MKNLFHVSRFTFHERGPALPKLQRSEGGFTIIELLVSVAIIAVLSSLVLVNMGFGNRQQNLLRAAQQLALDIRRAQNLSLAPTDLPSCVYGLKINSTTDYFIYRNCAGGAGGYVYAGDTLENTTLKNSITVSNFSAAMDIAFEAPEPITYFNGDKTGLVTPPITITLRSSDNSTKSVAVNRFGQVEIQ